MSTTTTNLGLIKPELTDNVSITDINENMDKIDATVSENINKIVTGWIPLTGTFAYHSKDSSTATNGTMYTVKLTTSIDLTQLVELGCRFKFSHDNAVKYGILVAKDTTSITLLLELNTSVLDGTKPIDNIYLSAAKCPIGFSLNPNDWCLTLTNNVGKVVSSPTTGWSNLSGFYIDIFAGIWDIVIGGCIGSEDPFLTSFSSNINSVSDSIFTKYTSTNYVPLTLVGSVSNTAKTRYYMINSITANTSVIYSNDTCALIIKATCAYL